jgi:hypothetical protein
VTEFCTHCGESRLRRITIGPESSALCRFARDVTGAFGSYMLTAAKCEALKKVYIVKSLNVYHRIVLHKRSKLSNRTGSEV